MIKTITIENIKGIDSKIFNLDIIPNKPSLLVAPNGFGKSSIAAAFASLQQNRIALHDNHLHKGDSTKLPKIIVKCIDENANTVSLEANSTTNQICEYFDYFVINNQVKAKGIGRHFNGRTNVSASMMIEPIILIDNVPERKSFDYSYNKQKQRFGANGKVLPNIDGFFDNRLLIDKLSDLYVTLDKISGIRYQHKIEQFKGIVNGQNGQRAMLLEWMVNTGTINSLIEVEPLRAIADLLSTINTQNITSPADNYLAALQIADLYVQDKTAFKQACKYSHYILEMEQYKSVFTAFNSSWCNFSPKERNGSLIVEFPNVHYISNGQRDILSFVSLLHKARRKLKKQNSILIIDEIFDYLDEANLVAVQYYITEFIEDYRRENKKMYPLIFTHLNPYYFKNFTFSKQKCYFLNQRNVSPDTNLVKLLQKREESSIKDDVSRYLLHYHTSQICKRSQFRTLGLKETWGESDNFDKFINQELEKYLTDQVGYDPFAVCCAVRKSVEKKIYDQLLSSAQKHEFLNNWHKTKEKLEYAENSGVTVPEYYYLLCIIYNDGLHWKENRDNVSPIMANLENKTIAHLIKKLCA